MRMLITDLDNTLYDWVTFFAKSFTVMVDALVDELGCQREELLDEFRMIHQQHGDSEQPFAALDLPCVRERFGDLSRLELKRRLEGPLRAFNSARKQHLRLYESVFHTLSALYNHDILIVGHTEAIKANAYYRLEKLGVSGFFQRLYVRESAYPGHPDPDRAAELSPPEGFVHVLPKAKRKPNPEVLLEICSDEGISPSQTFYVGDSLTRDVSMAKAAGVTAIWARYGTRYDRKLWDTLVRVTHWTEQDVRREAELKRQFESIQPDFVIDSFSVLLQILDIAPLRVARAV